MPTVSTNQNGGIVRWDKNDWLAGLVPFYDTFNFTDYVGDTGFINTTAMDPQRKMGYLMPGVLPASVTNENSVNALAKNLAIYSTKAYPIAGNLLHEYTISSRTITASGGTFPHTISAHGGHSTVVGEDVIFMSDAGTPYIFYSWNDNTDGDVGRYDLSTTFDDDYMSTVPTGGAVLNKDYPHPMVLGSDGILYIGDGNNLASLNFTSDVFNPSALDIPAGFVMTSFAKLPDFLVIFASSRSTSNSNDGESFAFFWNYRDASFAFAYPLQGNYVNGGFSFKSTVGCFTSGKNLFPDNSKLCRMLIFNGSNFEPVINFPDGVPQHGSIEVSDNCIYFLPPSGSIFRYGTVHIGTKESLQKICAGIGVNSGPGLLKNVGNGEFLLSTGASGGSGSLETAYQNYADAEAYTPVFELPLSPWSKARITKVKIYWLDEGADTGGDYRTNVWLRYNSGGQEQKIVDEDQAAPFEDSSSADDFATIHTTDVNGNPLRTATSLGLRVSYAPNDATKIPAVIRAIEVYYEFVKV